MAIGGTDVVPQLLADYRRKVNPKMVFFCLDLTGRSVCSTSLLTSEKDILVCGFSDSILRFLGESDREAQLLYVETIEQTKMLSS